MIRYLIPLLLPLTACAMTAEAGATTVAAPASGTVAQAASGRSRGMR